LTVGTKNDQATTSLAIPPHTVVFCVGNHKERATCHYHHVEDRPLRDRRDGYPLGGTGPKCQVAQQCRSSALLDLLLYRLANLFVRMADIRPPNHLA
jgi:hypothetical protein